MNGDKIPQVPSTNHLPIKQGVQALQHVGLDKILAYVTRLGLSIHADNLEAGALIALGRPSDTTEEIE